MEWTRNQETQKPRNTTTQHPPWERTAPWTFDLFGASLESQTLHPHPIHLQGIPQDPWTSPGRPGLPGMDPAVPGVGTVRGGRGDFEDPSAGAADLEAGQKRAESGVVATNEPPQASAATSHCPPVRSLGRPTQKSRNEIGDDAGWENPSVGPNPSQGRVHCPNGGRDGGGGARRKTQDDVTAVPGWNEISPPQRCERPLGSPSQRATCGHPIPPPPPPPPPPSPPSVARTHHHFVRCTCPKERGAAAFRHGA